MIRHKYYHYYFFFIIIIIVVVVVFIIMCNSLFLLSVLVIFVARIFSIHSTVLRHDCALDPRVCAVVKVNWRNVLSYRSTLVSLSRRLSKLIADVCCLLVWVTSSQHAQ